MKDYTYKNWKKEDYYDFSVEMNRIEGYNEYCKKWLKYFNISIENFESKVNWQINDLVDISDFNRVKNNINFILKAINSGISKLNVSEQYNQNFTSVEANEIEERLKEYLKQLGEWQFSYDICGQTICGNTTKIGGVN